MKGVESKEFVSRIHEMSKGLEEALSLLYNALIYNKEALVGEAEALVEKVKAGERGLTEELIEASQSDEVARRFSPIPSHLERIASNLDHVARSIRTKIKDDILFSDKAISELGFLFQRAKEILGAVNEIILSRNTYLANYVKESELEIERTANQFSTLHEERLIEGLCLPKASGIYIVILDSIKRIVYNAKEIAHKLTK